MTATPILSTVFNDIGNYHKKLTSYNKLIQFIINSDDEYGAIPVEYDIKNNQLTVKLSNSEVAPIIEEIHGFTTAPKMSRALDVKFFDVANSITDGEKFMKSANALMTESEKTTCYINALNGHTSIIESINSAINGTDTSGTVDFNSTTTSFQNCANQYGFNSESNPFDYAVKFYFNLSETLLKGIEKGVNLSNTSTYFQGKNDEYNKEMYLDDTSLLHAFIGASKRVVHHTDKQKSSVEGSQAQYEHTLCAKYSLVKSSEFAEDIKKIKDLEFLNTTSKEFNTEYKDYQSWTYALSKEGYYDYLSSESVYKALNADKAIKDSVMSKLKALSKSDDVESQVLDSMENKPEAILSLYQLAITEGPNQQNGIQLFNVVSPVYDNFCKPLASDAEEVAAHNHSESDL